MLRTWPFNYICCLMLLITAVHTYICFNWRPGCDCKTYMMCTSRWRQDKGTLLWPSEDAALINDQRLVSEHACGVCIVLDHIISHTNIDVHTRLAHVRLVFHQTEQLRSCNHSHTCAVFGDIQSFEKCSLWSFGNHLTSFENMKPLRLTVWLWLHDWLAQKQT